MNRNKSPNPPATSLPAIYDKALSLRQTFIDPEPKFKEKINYRTLDHFTKPKQQVSKLARMSTRPHADATSNACKLRTVCKSKDAYLPSQPLCETCKKLICNCENNEEISSEPDDLLSSERLKNENSKTVLLIKGLYPWRPATVLFDYPPQCQKPSRVSPRVITLKEEELNQKPLFFKVTDSAVSYNCFINAFLSAGFSQTTGGNFNVIISGVPKPDFIRDLNPYQKTNHFPGIWQLGRKDNLWRNLLKMRRKFGKSYEFCPYTYLLPEDFHRLQADREEHPKNLWILKPAALSCGRGIKVISHKSKLSDKKTGFIVSRYIKNPHLINGLKYDLRVYVGVTSFDPLRVFIYKEGLVRFATEKYSSKLKSLKKRFVHLTNFSVNKNSAKFMKDQDGKGSKWSLTALKAKYAEIGANFDSVFLKIEDVVIKTMISVEPHIVNSINQGSKNRANCFETYGFDILIDSNFKPWLIEVNVCPSLASSSPLDKQIKTSLMCDIFTLASIVPYDRGLFEKEKENSKSIRLYGTEKSAKAARNISNIITCENLENFEFSPEDLEMLADCEEDLEKSGDFKLVFPLKENVDLYSGFFEVVRYNNTLLWKHIKSSSNVLKKDLFR